MCFFLNVFSIDKQNRIWALKGPYESSHIVLPKYGNMNPVGMTKICRPWGGKEVSGAPKTFSVKCMSFSKPWRGKRVKFCSSQLICGIILNQKGTVIAGGNEMQNCVS